MEHTFGVVLSYMVSTRRSSQNDSTYSSIRGFDQVFGLMYVNSLKIHGIDLE